MYSANFQTRFPRRRNSHKREKELFFIPDLKRGIIPRRNNRNRRDILRARSFLYPGEFALRREPRICTTVYVYVLYIFRITTFQLSSNAESCDPFPIPVADALIIRVGKGNKPAGSPG